MKNYLLIGLVIGILLTSTICLAAMADNRYISVQGRLSTDQGPVSGTTKDFVFRICVDADCSVAVGIEDFAMNNLNLDNGVFNARVGPITGDFSDERWLAIQVEGEWLESPVPISASGYTFAATGNMAVGENLALYDDFDGGTSADAIGLAWRHQGDGTKDFNFFGNGDTTLDVILLDGDLTVASGNIYIGGIAGGTSGLRYSTTYPNYGIFYTESSPDYVSISPGGESTPDLRVWGNGTVDVKGNLNAGGTICDVNGCIGGAGGDYVLKAGDTMTGGLNLRCASGDSCTDSAKIDFRSNLGDFSKIYSEQYSGTNENRLVILSGDDGQQDYTLFKNYHYNDGTKDVMAVKRDTVELYDTDLIMHGNYQILELDSSSSGSNTYEQAAIVSIGESGYSTSGGASLHLTYTGDGYGHIGMGKIVSAIPEYEAIRLYYTSNNVRVMGDLTVSGASTNFRKAIWDVDGPGSGIDADTVDGYHASDFPKLVSGVVSSNIVEVDTGCERHFKVMITDYSGGATGSLGIFAEAECTYAGGMAMCTYESEYGSQVLDAKRQISIGTSDISITATALNDWSEGYVIYMKHGAAGVCEDVKVGVKRTVGSASAYYSILYN